MSAQFYSRANVGLHCSKPYRDNIKFRSITCHQLYVILINWFISSMRHIKHFRKHMTEHCVFDSEWICHSHINAFRWPSVTVVYYGTDLKGERWCMASGNVMYHRKMWFMVATTNACRDEIEKMEMLEGGKNISLLHHVDHRDNVRIISYIYS